MRLINLFLSLSLHIVHHLSAVNSEVISKNIPLIKTRGSLNYKTCLKTYNQILASTNAGRSHQ